MEWLWQKIEHRHQEKGFLQENCYYPVQTNFSSIEIVSQFENIVLKLRANAL